MKRIAVAAALVVAGACGVGRVSVDPAETRAEGGYEIFGPFIHENLSVFLIRKPDALPGDEDLLTLEEALRAGAVRVAEKADGAEVNELEVENVGDRPVYLQAGDTVKGGKQDRAIAIDFVLPPRSGKTKVDAFCVEPGRWSPRGGGESFVGAAFALATSDQKRALKEDASQSAVWEAGRKVNRALALRSELTETPDSYVLASEAPKIREETEVYVRALAAAVEGRRDLVGAAFAVNGVPRSVEIYRTPALFAKVWPKLLGAAAVEALAERTDGPVAKQAAASEIAALLRQGDGEEIRVRELPGGIRMKSRLTEEVVLFDTEQDGVLLHRQVIRR